MGNDGPDDRRVRDRSGLGLRDLLQARQDPNEVTRRRGMKAGIVRVVSARHGRRRGPVRLRLDGRQQRREVEIVDVATPLDDTQIDE